jgi:hypothetical protein
MCVELKVELRDTEPLKCEFAKLEPARFVKAAEEVEREADPIEAE